jgi:hypothetical protein
MSSTEPVWSSWEDTELKRLWADEDASPKAIARKMRRATEACRVRAKLLGLAEKDEALRMDTTWEEAEVNKLKDMMRDNYLMPAITKALKRSRGSVEGAIRRYELRLLYPAKTDNRAPNWTDREKNLITEMRARGVPMTMMVASLPGRTRHGIASKIKEMDVAIRRMGREAAAKPPPPPTKAIVKDEPEEQWMTPWMPPPYVVWPPLIVPSSRTCQYPMWQNGHKAPNPPTYCGVRAYKHSMCDEHFHRCYHRVGERPVGDD